jgi:two-component system cell cycle sensor histidine kinase/response regulator CckA
VKDERKTKKQLIAEMVELRQHLTEATLRLGEMEASEAKLKQVEKELRLYSEKLKDLVEDKARILQESGENFRSLADNAGDGIFISVGEGTHVYANRRAAEMPGYSVTELLNITVEDLMSPDERQRVVTQYRKRLAGENVPNQYETVILRKDGANVPVELTAARTVWHAQPAVMAIMRDITERVRSEATRARAEEALRESEAKIRTLAEQSPNMIFIYRRGKVVYANQHCAEVTGYEREEFYAPDFDFMDLIAPEHRELIRSNLARHMRGEEVEPYEYRLLTKEGKPVDVIITTKLIDYEGEAAIFGIVTDITERKRAEVALESERDKLQALMDGLARAEIGIDVVGIDYRILFQNQTLKEEFGDLAGELCYEKYRGLKEPCDFCPMVEAVKSGKVAGAELTGADGRRYELLSAPLPDPDGTVDKALEVVKDVTERQHLEAQVRQQERLAAIGQLAGGIAHDFNNYLTTIMLYAQILSNAPDLPPALMSNAQTIVDESRGAARLVQQILDFSRRSMMEAVLVDLVSFVEEVTSILRRTLPENIRLLIEVGVDDLVVKADPTRIQQVVMNLVLNARDAMPEGGELCIKLSKVRTGSSKEPPAVETLPPDIPDGEWVCMTISDTGTGMTEEVQSHLFEPFFTTKGTQGTGLGLAQVHGIVKQHDGYIGIKTEAGEGTTFCICLPAHEVEKKTVVEATLALPTGEGETILLVEDEERVREAIHEMLEMLGYQVLIAANGLEALETYQSAAEVDLVLTDVVMPEMGGAELVKELQRKDPGLKALALTGHTLAKDIELRAAGISEVVPKPVEMHVLAEAIHRVLGRDAR